MANQNDHPFLLLSLEHVVRMNQQALEYLSTGDEIRALVVLTDALTLLWVTGLQNVGGFAAHQAFEGNHVVDILPHGVTVFTLPSIPTSCPDQGPAPSVVLSIVDDGSFSVHHGLHNTQRILMALVLYHAALTVHRQCCRLERMDRRELTRSRDLYHVCDGTFANAPELKLVRFIVDASIGHLYGMFDCPAAA
jgi:hypothetical protein